MATDKSAKQGFGAKFMHWYGSYQGKVVVNIIYSAGASVVIIGALFKILHWPGASQVLMLGMFTEAFLFLIGTLEHPHPEFHWENVFPQLLEYGTKPELLEEKSKQARPTLLGAGVADNSQPSTFNQGQGTTAPAPANAKVPTLKEEDVKALKEGIADLAKTAGQLAELGKVAQTGVKLGEKLEAAEAAVDSYTAATVDLAKTYAQVNAEMTKVADDTRAYKQGVEQVGKSIASLNSVYELQLQEVNAQIAAQKEAVAAQKEAVNAQKEAIAAQKEVVAAHKEAVVAAKEATEAQAAFTTGAKQLQKYVADLNGIYGNMLNALA